MLPFSQAIVSHVAGNAANGVVVGIPMVAVARQRSRRNSLASAPLSIQHRQRCSQVMRASLDEPDNDDDCPFTTLYWDYLIRHQAVLGKNHRMGLQLRNLDRIDDAQRDQIVLQARTIRDNPAVCFKQK